MERNEEMNDLNKITDTLSLLELAIKLTKKPLSERDYDIINLRFGLDGGKSKTLQQIADKHKLSRERVRQIIERTIKLTRGNLRDELYTAHWFNPKNQAQ